jgi:hypothetical protein
MRGLQWLSLRDDFLLVLPPPPLPLKTGARGDKTGYDMHSVLGDLRIPYGVSASGSGDRIGLFCASRPIRTKCDPFRNAASPPR